MIDQAATSEETTLNRQDDSGSACNDLLCGIPRDQWEWFGNAGHLIVGQWCRFHLTTKVGPWLVSTVGEYVHPRHGMGSEQQEAEWLKEHWPGEDIGCDRKYETMVFRAGEPCSCGCGMPTIDGHEQAVDGYNDAKAARDRHLRLCEEWAAKSAA